jgi:hypothetical protein
MLHTKLSDSVGKDGLSVGIGGVVLVSDVALGEESAGLSPEHGSFADSAIGTSQEHEGGFLAIVSELLEQGRVSLLESFVAVDENLELRSTSGCLLSPPNTGCCATNNTKVTRVVALRVIMGEGGGNSRQGKEKPESYHGEQTTGVCVFEGVKCERGESECVEEQTKTRE